MTALYRAYRPQKFDDVVGQQSVVRTLRNAIANDRVAHAYLFTGPKGTGKTTMAKLLAKAMNCENGPTVDPCGACESCVSIADGRSMDVAEIDAASNTGIDAVREKIIDTVAFQPTSGTRRVYILDEAHQLSASAFNALLKTIEEPPAHVLFIFCTTETHKMMATVRDRCQRLALLSPSADDLVGVLERVAAQESITTDELSYRAIARVAQGSFRNALGTLEMLATAFDKSFTHADVIAHLGTFSEDLLFDAADAMLASDTATILRTTEQLVQDGSDLNQFVIELAQHLRTVLLAIHGVEAAGVAVGDTARLAAQAKGADERKLLATIDCINDAVTRIRVGSDPRLAVEAALVRACQGLGLPALALRLAALEHGARGEYGAPLATPAPAAVPARRAEATSAVAERAPAAPPVSAPAPAPGGPSTAPAAPPAKPVAPTAVDVPASDVAAWWPQVLAAAAGDASVKAQVSRLTPVEANEQRLVVSSPIAAMFTERQRSALQALVLQVTGRTMGIDVRDSGDAPDDTALPTVAPPSIQVDETAELAEAHAADEATEAAKQPGSKRAAALDVAPAAEPALVPAAGDSQQHDDEGLDLFAKTFDTTELPAQ